MLPCLLLNYIGQGALLLDHPEAIENPFYRLYPEWVVSRCDPGHAGDGNREPGGDHWRVLADAAGHPARPVAAPAIHHTSEQVFGQIYMPRVNWLLFIGVLSS